KMTQLCHVLRVAASATLSGKGRDTLPPALPRESLTASCREGEQRLNPRPVRRRGAWGATLSQTARRFPAGRGSERGLDQAWGVATAACPAPSTWHEGAVGVLTDAVWAAET